MQITQKIEAKAFRTFLRVYHLLNSEWLIAGIKLTLHKALNRSIMNCACHAYHDNCPKCTAVRGLHMVSKFRTFKISSHCYDGKNYETKIFPT